MTSRGNVAKDQTVTPPGGLQTLSVTVEAEVKLSPLMDERRLKLCQYLCIRFRK